ncbi:MAG: FAD-dependent oxidoreductase [Ignavibacteriaceae bacterium]|nr:FAD-dependent oxidoreductase [Ignavibacteriaceae bacterium]
MDKVFDIVIIGGGEDALCCAFSSSISYPEKSIAVLSNAPLEANTYLQLCENFKSGISTTSKSKEELTCPEFIRDQVLTKVGKKLKLYSGDSLVFDKLVIATGSTAIVPNIEGSYLNGVHLLKNEWQKIHEIISKITSESDVIIYGGGFFGVTLANQLAEIGKSSTLISRSDRLLPTSMDAEIGREVQALLEKKGVRVLTDTKIRRVVGENSVKKVILDSGAELNCNLLIISCGQKPDISVAEKLGLVFDKDRGILVDEYLRTSKKDIYAIGACAAKFDFFTGDLANLILAATANLEACIAGSNLYSSLYSQGNFLNKFCGQLFLKNYSGFSISESRKQNEGEEKVLLSKMQ